MKILFCMLNLNMDHKIYCEPHIRDLTLDISAIASLLVLLMTSTIFSNGAKREARWS